MPDKLTRQQFAQKIKSQYPQVANTPDDQLVDTYLKKHPDYAEYILETTPSPNAKIAGPPKGMAAVKSAVNTGMQRAGEKIVSNLPLIGATVGGVAGSPAGPAGAVAGAALGGAAGKAAQQIEAFSRHKGPKTSGEAAGDIALEGTIQGLFELGGLGIAKFAKMLAPASRAELLAYGSKGGDIGKEAWEKLIPEFDKTLNQAGSRGAKTVGEFEQVIRGTQSRLGNEYGLGFEAKLSTGKKFGDQKVVPIDIANAIRSAKRVPKTQADIAFNRVLDRRALEFENQTWSMRELDKERGILAKRNLAGREKQPISSMIADTTLDAEAAADKAANQALNDLIYKQLDVANGKPLGYYADIQSKQRSLYTLHDLTQAAKRRLGKVELEEGGAGITERMHLRGYLHPNTLRPGGVAGVPLKESGKDLTKANEAIARGFPSTSRKVANAARKAVALPLSNADIDALPLRAFWESLNEPTSTSKTPGQMKRELREIQKRGEQPSSSNPLSPAGVR